LDLIIQAVNTLHEPAISKDIEFRANMTTPLITGMFNDIITGDGTTNSTGQAVVSSYSGNTYYAGNYTWWGYSDDATANETSNFTIKGGLNATFNYTDDHAIPLGTGSYNASNNSVITFRVLLESFGRESEIKLNNSYNANATINLTTPSDVYYVSLDYLQNDNYTIIGNLTPAWGACTDELFYYETPGDDNEFDFNFTANLSITPKIFGREITQMTINDNGWAVEDISTVPSVYWPVIGEINDSFGIFPLWSDMLTDDDPDENISIYNGTNCFTIRWDTKHIYDGETEKFEAQYYENTEQWHFVYYDISPTTDEQDYFFMVAISNGSSDGTYITPWDEFEQIPTTDYSFDLFSYYNGSFTLDDSQVSSASEIWNASIMSSADFFYDNISAIREINITKAIAEENTAPTDPSPIINSTDGSNKTTADLNCTAVISDPDSDTLDVTVRWYLDDALNWTQDYNNSYESGYFFTADIESGNTTKGQNWTCEIKLYDGQAHSNFVNSSDLWILNSLPTVTLTAPDDNNYTVNRTPTFTWTGDDDDDDALEYEINLSCFYSDGSYVTAGSMYKDKTVVSTDTLFMPLPEEYLKCLQDNNYNYEWNVRAHDGDEFGSWTGTRNLSIQSHITTSLTTSMVNFSIMNMTDIDDTSDDDPPPLVLQNDGNTEINVSAEFTDIFLKATNPSDNFKYKIRNHDGGKCYVDAHTQTEWAQAHTSSSQIIERLNFTSGYLTDCDAVSIDLYVEVPQDESSGKRGSTITFTSSLIKSPFDD
jgi:hypothetical protein